MPNARVLAQAKINLLLHVLARETSGYHQIETLFCRIDLADVVTVSPGDGERSLRCHGERLPSGGLGLPSENLAWRAAAAYAHLAGWPNGFAIDIEKRIPVGGGLGGGSADAGAVLRALNALNPRPLPPAVLLSIACSLGADVPFLTQDATTLALGWGRGERLLALPALEPRPCFLFVGDHPVSTSEAYGWLDEQPPSSPASLVDPATLHSWDGVRLLADNDFEPVVAPRYPVIADALAAFRSPAGLEIFGSRPLVQLSGTGSTVFAIDSHGKETNFYSWRSDEPGVSVLLSATSDHVQPVEITE